MGAWASRKAEVKIVARVARRGRRRRLRRTRARNRLAGCLCSRTPEKSQFKAQRGRQRWRWGDLQAWVIEYELLRLGSFLITDWLTRFGGCLGPSDASNYTYDVDDADDVNPDMTLLYIWHGLNFRRRRYDLAEVEVIGWEPPRTQWRAGKLAVWEQLGTAN